MNATPTQRQEMILNTLIEGNSIRSTERITQTHRDTIMRLLVRVGDRCQQIVDTKLTDFHCKRIQADEIWTFVRKKQARLKPEEKIGAKYGDQYVFVALDPDSKLVPVFEVGKRDFHTTMIFISKLKEKLKDNGRIQITTDGFKPYISALDTAFVDKIDYAQLIKIYGSNRDEARYALPQIQEVISTIIKGNPDREHISTSYVERQNLTMRMHMRRFTRLTNAFSKKLENLKAAVALHFYHYNFMRVHKTLRVTPAMEAKITDHIWDWKVVLSY